MSIKYYKSSQTMCFVTEYRVVIQNRGKIHIVVLKSSAFFIYEQKQVRLNFFFSVSLREKTERIRQNYKQLRCTYLFKEVLGKWKLFRIQFFQNSQSFENIFPSNSCLLCFQLIHSSKNSVLGKTGGKFTLQAVPTGVALLTTQSRCVVDVLSVKVGIRAEDCWKPQAWRTRLVSHTGC